MGVKRPVKRTSRKTGAAVSKIRPADLKKHMTVIEEEIARQRRAGKYEHFTSISPEELEKKLQRVNSPFLTSQGWSSAPPGGSFGYTVGIHNPDPTSASNLYVYVFVGPGNCVSDTGLFLLNVDTRFARQAQPPFFGITLASLASTSQNFTIQVPAAVEKTTYFGNSVLLQPNYNDIGTYLDRAAFPFTVT